MADEDIADADSAGRIRVWRVWGQRAEEDGGWGARETDIAVPTDRRQVGEVSGSGPWGRYWTDVEPSTVADYRNDAGLPNENRGRYVTEGTVDLADVDRSGAAVELDGNEGGLHELEIPDAEERVQVVSVQGLNETWTRPAEPDSSEPAQEPSHDEPAPADPADALPAPEDSDSAATEGSNRQVSLVEADEADEAGGATNEDLDAMDEATDAGRSEDDADSSLDVEHDDPDREL